MLNQFSRTELLFGKEAMEKLAGSRVAVFGIGGVGGYTVEALVRSGVGAIDLIDDDKVCLTNLNRQIIATRSTVGKYKVDVMKERILDINPKAEVNVHKCFYLPETKDEFDFSKYDYVVDAVDTVTAKIQLVMEAKEKSGSLITADMALEQGRDIYALPGMVTEPLSCGCNRLIRQGAGILLSEEDLLEELVIKGLLKKKIAIISDTKNKIKLETKENLVYSKLGLYPRGLDDLQRETGLTPQEVMGICVSLQLKGCIQERSKNYYVRAK